MSAATLLADLDAVGVHVTREGDALRVRGNPGADPAPYRERIREAKAELLRELLQREIVAAVIVEPVQFDRERYQRLWEQWRQLP
jgi:TubC N-terminal docking domain